MKRILRPEGRLSLCADYVRSGSRLADIGTDHGYLPIELCLKNKIPSALACDINPQPLNAAKVNIAGFGLSGRIETRLSNGLEKVGADEVDDIVIAGMGGELIRDILSAAEWVRDSSKRLVLQPMTHHEDLYKWLCENGFSVIRQDAVYDEGKYYTALLAEFSGKRIECDLYSAIVGRLDTKDKNSRGFLSRCLNNMKNKSRGDETLLPVVKKLSEVLDEAL